MIISQHKIISLCSSVILLCFSLGTVSCVRLIQITPESHDASTGNWPSEAGAAIGEQGIVKTDSSDKTNDAGLDGASKIDSALKTDVANQTDSSSGALSKMKFHPGFWGMMATRLSPADQIDMSNIQNKAYYVGAVVVYPWNVLEPSYGNYNLALIRQDLNNAVAVGKKFGIYLRGESFSPTSCTPTYMLNDSTYGGVTPGFYGNYTTYNNDAGTMWWNAKVKERWKALLKAISDEFDNDPNLSFIMWKEETTRGATTADDPSYSCDGEIAALKEINAYGYSIFTKTPFFFYLNWDCTANFATTWHQWIVNNGVGAWTSVYYPIVNSRETNAYSFYRAYYPQIASLASFDTWDTTTANAINTVLNTLSTFQARYFVISRDGAPKMTQVETAVESWWNNHASGYPYMDRPQSTPWQ